MLYANLRELLAWQHKERPARPRLWHVWGPVSSKDVIEAGCLASTSSICFKVEVPSSILSAAMGCIPQDIFPRPYDTAASLAARLGVNLFLDHAHVLNKGNGKRGRYGKKRVSLLESTFSQPRRMTCSVAVEDAELDDDGDEVWHLFNYTDFGRLAEDWRCSPMPLPIFDLGVQLWSAAHPYLSSSLKQVPPSHCQILFYYTLFDSKMGRHRDNYNLKWFKSILNDEAATAGTPMGGHENSQHVGSDVLIYTQGDTPMDFQLSFPQPGNLDCATKEYVMKPAFAVSLSAGTLLIYKDIDDQLFCHEANFPIAVKNTLGHRVAFVYRWCTSVKRFHAAPEKRAAFKGDSRFAV